MIFVGALVELKRMKDAHYVLKSNTYKSCLQCQAAMVNMEQLVMIA